MTTLIEKMQTMVETNRETVLSPEEAKEIGEALRLARTLVEQHWAGAPSVEQRATVRVLEMRLNGIGVLP